MLGYRVSETPKKRTLIPMDKSYSMTESPSGTAGFGRVGGQRRPSSAGDAWHFVSTFVLHPKITGAVAPSSRKLAEAMISGADLQNANLVIELGAGTGAITELIRERMKPNATLISLEMNSSAVDRLRRRFRGLHVICDSAENLRLHLDFLGHRHADCIISSLPWVSMGTDLQGRLLDSIVASLKPGGSFSTMAYLHASAYLAARRFKAELGRHFGEIKRSKVVWANVPPAFAYYGRRNVA
jgi:phospholipid N-methyltransferase